MTGSEHRAPRTLAVLLLLPALLALAAGPARSAERGWRSPVRPMEIQRRFDLPAHDWLPGHRGVDLATRPGQEVGAAGMGRVTFAAELAGRGVVVVDHGAVRTTYQPVEAVVTVGEHVGAGQQIGVVGTGAGHCGDGDCLHLGLRQNDTYLDPLLILLGARAVLRPW